MVIEEVAENTYRLETPITGINTVFAVYLINEGDGALIETGPTAAVDAIQEGMKRLGMNSLAYVIPTHIHMDHAAGAGKVAELYPESRVIFHPQSVKHAIDPTRLIQSTRMAFGEDFEDRYGPILPVPEVQVKTVEDGEDIDLGDRSLKVIYAPGHAAHNLSLFDNKTRGLFCGEALGIPLTGADWFLLPGVAPPGFDMEAYLGTIEKLKALRPRLLFYSHDGISRDPEKLIPAAEHNIRVFGEIVLETLSKGESLETAERRVREYILAQTRVSSEGIETTMAVNGYAIYFKKAGLLD